MKRLSSALLALVMLCALLTGCGQTGGTGSSAAPAGSYDLTSLPAYDGVVDDFATKRDMFVLSPLATYELIWSVTVE